MRLQLAQTLPETWDLQFRNTRAAQAEFAELEEKRTKLAAAVERLKKRAERDICVDLSNADFRCLTLEELKRAAAAYKAVIGRADPFEVDSVRQQFLIYQQLGILRENVAAALTVLPEAPVEEKKARPCTSSSSQDGRDRAAPHQGRARARLKGSGRAEARRRGRGERRRHPFP